MSPEEKLNVTMAILITIIVIAGVLLLFGGVK